MTYRSLDRPLCDLDFDLVRDRDRERERDRLLRFAGDSDESRFERDGFFLLFDDFFEL